MLLEMDASCVFCRIVAGEIPTEEVISTDKSYSFRDVDPKAPTHVLVVPRVHLRDAYELDHTHGELLADLFQTARRVAETEGLVSGGPDDTSGGYRLVFNVGDDAGNSVPHLHLHVLGGRKLDWPPG